MRWVRGDGGRERRPGSQSGPWLFLINLPIAAALLVGAQRLMPATRPVTPRPFDWAGSGLTLTALVLFGLGTVAGTFAGFAASAASAAGADGIERALLMLAVLLAASALGTLGLEERMRRG